MAKAVLITGGAGLVGQAVHAALRRQGAEVLAPDTLLENLNDWRALLSERKWDSIVHLAALSSYDFCESHPEITFETNVRGTENLGRLILEHCADAHFVFSSTAQVYDIAENRLTESSEVAPRTAYARSKLLAEGVVDKLSKQGLRASILRIFNHTHKTQRPEFFLPSVYQQMLQVSKTAETRLKVGNIDVKRDIGAVSDLAEAITQLIFRAEELPHCDTFNVCSGQPRVLRNLVELLGEHLKISFDTEVDPKRYRANEPISMVGSFEKLNRMIGWRPLHVSDQQLIESFLAPLLE